MRPERDSTDGTALGQALQTKIAAVLVSSFLHVPESPKVTAAGVVAAHACMVSDTHASSCTSPQARLR